MKTYEAKYNPFEHKGVYGISLVENPAMEGLFIALSKQTEVQFKEVDKEQRILMGLVLEPNKPVYRNQGGEEFNIVFSEDTIKDLSYGFFKTNSQKNSTIEHSDKGIQGVTFTESWIVENPEVDKSTNFGFSYPKGSWLAVMKVDSDEVWDGYVKTGKVQGFSIDAMLSLEEVNLKSNINMSKQEEVSFIQLLKDLPNQIKLALTPTQTKIELGSVMLADGSLKIEFEGDAITKGASVWVTAEDGTKVPVPVGEHPLEDGTVLIVTTEGVAEEVKAKVEEGQPNPEQPMAEDGKVSNDAKIASEIESAIKSILIKYSEQGKAIEVLTAKNVEFEKQITELSAQPASKPIRSNPTQVDLKSMTSKERLMFTVQNAK